MTIKERVKQEAQSVIDDWAGDILTEEVIAKMAEDIAARVEAAETMSEWRSIESCPKSRSQEILLWFPYSTPGLSVPGCRLIGIWGYPNEDDDEPRPTWVDATDGNRIGDTPTHWMPLPSPPTANAS